MERAFCRRRHHRPPSDSRSLATVAAISSTSAASTMSTKKLGWWVSALMTRFEEQLPCRNGPQTHHTRINVQQNKESLIHISKWKFSLVISGLTKMLTNINEMRPHPPIPELERDYYESLHIVLDTLEKCLSSQAAEAPKYDDVMNVRILLKEICQFLDLPQAGSPSQQVLQIRTLAAKVLFALSVNNFNAVFSRISGRLQELSVSSGGEESPDHTDIELIQYINIDLQKLTKLLNEAITKFKYAPVQLNCLYIFLSITSHICTET